MAPSGNCIDLIKSQEGLVLHPYLDQASVPTIGYGTTRYPGGAHVTMKDGPITQQQAENYLHNDLQDTGVAVNAMVPQGLNQNQFDALVDFAYNVGTGALHGSTLLKLVKANSADPSIGDAFQMWDKIHVDGKLVVNDGLLKRRKAEAELYFS
ncbi:lysozyme [Puia sp. P3]|uniref:lysozyme n=1 Tax=Puia sp. P3 TaxID=3423952 RepID=UPI003D66908D